jgi:uncharacterized protein (DUF305 family)
MSHCRRVLRAGLLVLVVASGQPIAARQAPQDTEPKPRPDLVRYPYTAADVEFMAGMIPHHAQAVLMAKMAPTQAARPELKLMCERMLISQRDEIEFMRNWLRDRGQAVPAADATHHRMKMNGIEHDMLMPGMLSKEEMAALEKARGADWDRRFLEGMIKHHAGAIKMVDDLFAAHGALQDEDVYQFATDIYADQTSEIERMQKMLEAVEKRRP